MGRINSRNKGASGEREAAEWLYYNLNLHTKPERNLEQVRSGGGDLGPLLTGWVNWKYKFAGILWFIVMIYCWYVLFYSISPFTIGIK